MKQRLGIAAALLPSPRLLVLDASIDASGVSAAGTSAGAADRSSARGATACAVLWSCATVVTSDSEDNRLSGREQAD